MWMRLNRAVLARQLVAAGVGVALAASPTTAVASQPEPETADVADEAGPEAGPAEPRENAPEASGDEPGDEGPVAADVDREPPDASPAVVTPEPAAAAAEEPAPDAPADPGTDKRGRLRIGALGIGGIVLMAVGVGAIGGGAAMLARGREVAPDPLDPSMLEGRDFRPPGGGLLALGAVAVITGAVVLFVAVKKAQRKRNVAVGPGSVGVRF